MLTIPAAPHDLLARSNRLAECLSENVPWKGSGQAPVELDSMANPHTVSSHKFNAHNVKVSV